MQLEFFWGGWACGCDRGPWWHLSWTLQSWTCWRGSPGGRGPGGLCRFEESQAGVCLVSQRQCQTLNVVYLHGRFLRVYFPLATQSLPQSHVQVPQLLWAALWRVGSCMTEVVCAVATAVTSGWASCSDCEDARAGVMSSLLASHLCDSFLFVASLRGSRYHYMKVMNLPVLVPLGCHNRAPWPAGFLLLLWLLKVSSQGGRVDRSWSLFYKPEMPFMRGSLMT